MIVLSGSSCLFFAASYLILFCVVVCSGSCDSSAVNDPCGWFTAGQRYVYDYHVSVHLQLPDTAETAADRGEVNDRGSTGLTCRVSVETGHWGSCIHRLKFLHCSVGESSSGTDASWLDVTVTSLLSSNACYFELKADGVRQLMLESAEPDEVTNFRRSLVKLLTVDQRFFRHSAQSFQPHDARCRPGVSHVEDDLFQVTWPLECDLEEVTGSSRLCSGSDLFSRWLRTAIPSDAVRRCDYLLSDSVLRQITCGHTLPLQLLNHSLLTIISKQEISMVEIVNTPEHDCQLADTDPLSDVVTVTVAMTTRFMTPVVFTPPVSSVAESVHELFRLTPDSINDASIRNFDNLLSALRVSFEPPLDYVDNCGQNCSEVQKEFVSRMVTSALLLCNTALCEDHLATLLGSSRIRAYRVLPLVFSWLWSPVYRADQLSARLSICSSAELFWCDLYVFTSLVVNQYRAAKVMRLDVSEFDRLFDSLRGRILADIGDGCQGDTDHILHAIKLLSQVGDELFGEQAAGLLARCLTSDDGDGHKRAPLVVTEAVIAVTQLPIDLERQRLLLYKVVSDPLHHEMSRKSAFLHYMELLPDIESSYSPSLQMALRSVDSPFSRFVIGHMLSLPDGHLARKLTERTLRERSLSTASSAYFNLSTTQQWRLELLPSYFLHVAVWKLHSTERSGLEKFLPHLLRFTIKIIHNTSSGDGNENIDGTTDNISGRNIDGSTDNISGINIDSSSEDMVFGPLLLELRSARLMAVLKQLLGSVGEREVLRDLFMSTFGQLFTDGVIDQLLDPEAVYRLRELLHPVEAAVSDWLKPELVAGLMSAVEESIHDADTDISGVLSVSLAGRQVIYVTSQQLAAMVSQLSMHGIWDEWPLFGLIVSHWQTVIKPLQLSVNTVLPVGLPLQLSADLTSMVGSVMRVNSSLVMSARNLRENLGGDASLSLSSALSMTVQVCVFLPVFSLAPSSLYIVESPGASAAALWRLSGTSDLAGALCYLQRGRKLSVRLYKPGPHARAGFKTSFRRSFGIDTSSGNTGLTPVSPVCFENSAVWRYLALRVCHSWGGSMFPASARAAAVYQIGLLNADPEEQYYTVQLWTSRRADGYRYGASYHVRLLPPSLTSPGVHFTLSVRLRPINYNPHLFSRGNQANTTLELLVGSESAPVFRVYGRYARRQRGAVMFSEALLDVTKQKHVILKLRTLGNRTVWNQALHEWKNDVIVLCSVPGYGDWRAAQTFYSNQDLSRVRFVAAVDRQTQPGLAGSARVSKLPGPGLFLLNVTRNCDDQAHTDGTLCSSQLVLSYQSVTIVTARLDLTTFRPSSIFNCSLLLSLRRSVSENWLVASLNSSSTAISANNYRWYTWAAFKTPVYTTVLTGGATYRLSSELALTRGRCFSAALKQLDSEWRIGERNETIVTVRFNRWRGGDSPSSNSSSRSQEVLLRRIYLLSESVQVSMRSSQLSASLSYENTGSSPAISGDSGETRLTLTLNTSEVSSNLLAKYFAADQNSERRLHSMTASVAAKTACCLPSIGLHMRSTGSVDLNLTLPTLSDTWLMGARLSKSTNTVPVVYHLLLDTKSRRSGSSLVTVRIHDDPAVPGQIVANIEGSPSMAASASLSYLQTLHQKYSDGVSAYRRRLAVLTRELGNLRARIDRMTHYLVEQTSDEHGFLGSVFSPLVSTSVKLREYFSDTIKTVMPDKPGLWSAVGKYVFDSLWSLYDQLPFRLDKEQTGDSTVLRITGLPQYFSVQNLSASVEHYISELFSPLLSRSRDSSSSRYLARVSWKQHRAWSLTGTSINLSGDATCGELLFYHRASGLVVLLVDRYVSLVSPGCTALVSFCQGIVSLQCDHEHQRRISVYGDVIRFNFAGFSADFRLSDRSIDMSVDRWMVESSVGILVDRGSIASSLSERTLSVALDTRDTATCAQPRHPPSRQYPHCTDVISFPHWLSRSRQSARDWELVTHDLGKTKASSPPILRVNLAILGSNVTGMTLAEIRRISGRFLATLRRVVTLLDGQNVEVALIARNDDGGTQTTPVSLDRVWNVPDTSSLSLSAAELLQVLRQQVFCSTSASSAARVYSVYVVLGQSDEVLEVSPLLSSLLDTPSWSIQLVSTAEGVTQHEDYTCPDLSHSTTAMSVLRWLAWSTSGAVWNCSQSCTQQTIAELVDSIWRWSLKQSKPRSLIQMLQAPAHHANSSLCAEDNKSSAEPLTSAANTVSPIQRPHWLLLMLFSLFCFR